LQEARHGGDDPGVFTLLEDDGPRDAAEAKRLLKEAMGEIGGAPGAGSPWTAG